MRKEKKLLSALLAIAMLTTGGIANIASAEEANNVIYVSATLGDDANAGTLAAPLATIGAARLMARELSGSVTVEIMDGDYRLSSTMTLTADDSNVTYKAYEGDKPEIKASVSIPTSAAKKVKEAADEVSLAKMTADAREAAYVIKLADYGITQDMIVNGAAANQQYGITGSVEYNNFFVNGNSLNVAQWPNNKDYAQFDSVNDETSIIYTDNYCDKWAGETGWWVGLWVSYDYSYFKFAGVSVDAENNILDYTDSAVEKFNTKSNGEYDYRSKRWKAYNLLSEMDVPGEYYIDRDNLKLYFYPTSHLSGGKLELEVNLQDMIKITGAENVTFDGLTFTQTTGNVISASDVKNVDIKNCTFKDIGMSALRYNGTTEAATGNKYIDKDGNEAQFWQYQKKNGSYNCDIENNVFMNIGSSAVSMLGAGDIDTLTASNNHIKNNIIYNISKKSALYAIILGGCGVTVENNNISKAMVGGIYIYGNNHTIQYNEIYNLMAEAADGGAIYQGRADVFRGSEVKYNYIHDIVLADNETYNGLSNSQCGIYWDDGQTGMNANHNILRNIPNAFASNHAGDYVYSFNTTVDCTNAWDLTDYPSGETDLRDTVANGFTLAQLEELIVYKDLYYKEYENLEKIVAGNNPKKYSVLEGNLRVNSGVKEGEYNAAAATFTSNLSAETEDLTTIFADPQNQDYRVLSTSDYAALGVLNEAFDIDLIGIQTDFKLNVETASFEKLYPAKNENIGYQDEYNFTWSDALGANKYKVTVATDEAFENIVFEGETVQTGIAVTGLSDKTVYYWKVEAENTSRELANTWTTVDGVTSFGVDVAMYADTEAPEKPANLTGGAYATNGAGYTASNIPDELKVGSAGTPIKIHLKEDRTDTCDRNWYVSSIYLQDINRDSEGKPQIFHPESNTNYVFSIRAKTAEGNTKVGFAYNNKVGGYTVADHDIAGVQLGTDWTYFNTAVSVGDTSDTVGNDSNYRNYLSFGIVTGAVSDYIIYDSASPYLAEEIEYAIDIEADDTLLTSFNPINVSARVLNQVGTTGYLDQNVEWAVVTADRKEVVDGATVEYTENGATISVDGTVPTGTYALVAMSDTLTKGIDIEVISSFADTETPQKPANLTGGDYGANGAGYTVSDIPDELKVGAVGTPIKIHLKEDRTAACDSNWYVSSIYFRDINRDSAGKVQKLHPEANTNYVFSIRAKTVEGNTKVGFAYNYQAGKYAVADHDIAGVQLGTDWTYFNTAVSVGDTSEAAANYFSFGIVTGTVSDYIIYDSASPYIAKEIEYAIDIEADNTLLTPFNPINVSAKVLNQVGTTGYLDQNVKWAVVTADRKEVVDGATVEYTENGATIYVDETVPTGNYALVAISDSLIKGIDIEVISSFADTEAPELNGNLLTDGDCTGSGWKNNAGWGYSAYANGRNGGAIKASSNKDIVAGDSYWAAYGIFPTKWISDDTTSLFEANANYVFSIWAKDIKEDAAVPYSKLTMAFMCNTGKAYLNEYPYGSKMTLTDDWQEFKGTFTVPNGYTKYSSFTVGYPTTEATTSGMAMALDDAYLAKEQAYSMNITGDNEIEVGKETVISAELLNQIGTKGKLSQDFNWMVLNADRTAYADGVMLNENGDGTVTASGVETGTYTVLAMTEDNSFIKGYTVTVVKGEAPVEKIASAEFTQSGANVSFKARVENTDAEKVFFVIGEFNGKSLVKVVKSDIKAASEASCNLTLEGVAEGNIVKAFIWDNATLRPIDNVDNLALTYTVLATE